MGVTGSVLVGLLELVILAGGVLYAGAVVAIYRTDGSQHRLKLDRNEPMPSAEKLLLWLGVQVLALLVRIAVPILGLLSEASAEVGEWFIRRQAPEAQAAIRSRFML